MSSKHEINEAAQARAAAGPSPARARHRRPERSCPAEATMIPLLLVAVLLGPPAPPPRRPARKPPPASGRQEDDPRRASRRARPAGDDAIGDPARGLVSALTFSSVLWLLVLSLFW